MITSVQLQIDVLKPISFNSLFTLNKIPSVMSFGYFWLIAKIPNLFIHIIYMPWQVDWMQWCARHRVTYLKIWRYVVRYVNFPCFWSLWWLLLEIIKHFTRPLDGPTVLPRMLIGLWLIATPFLSLSHSVC
jgi:hypothetical protein